MIKAGEKKNNQRTRNESMSLKEKDGKGEDNEFFHLMCKYVALSETVSRMSQ